MNRTLSSPSEAAASLTLRLETSLFVDWDEDEQDFRLIAGRKNPEGGLIDPRIDATEFALGHIPEPRLGLVNQPGSLEPGATISNFPLVRQIEFARHRFVGLSGIVCPVRYTTMAASVHPVIRYRTVPISPREMTYIFLAGGIAAKNALSQDEVDFFRILLTDVYSIFRSGQPATGTM